MDTTTTMNAVDERLLTPERLAEGDGGPEIWLV